MHHLHKSIGSQQELSFTTRTLVSMFGLHTPSRVRPHRLVNSHIVASTRLYSHLLLCYSWVVQVFLSEIDMRSLFCSLCSGAPFIYFHEGCGGSVGHNRADRVRGECVCWQRIVLCHCGGCGVRARLTNRCHTSRHLFPVLHLRLCLSVSLCLHISLFAACVCVLHLLPPSK